MNPILFFDIEATGLDVQTARIVELCLVLLKPDESTTVHTLRFNPEMPIPAESTEVHGISDADVADKPPFRYHAQALLKRFTAYDLGGFNIVNYDIPLLYYEFDRCGLEWDWKKNNVVDAGIIYKRMEPRTLSAAVEYYTGKPLENAHSAEADTIATVNVFLEQKKKYADLPSNLDELSLFCRYDQKPLDIAKRFAYNSEGEIVFAFGKHRNKPAIQHPDFLHWMSGKDFGKDTLEIVHQLLHESYTT